MLVAGVTAFALAATALRMLCFASE